MCGDRYPDGAVPNHHHLLDYERHPASQILKPSTRMLSDLIAQHNRDYILVMTSELFRPCEFFVPHAAVAAVVILVITSEQVLHSLGL